jgi:hypothetical protein
LKCAIRSLSTSPGTRASKTKKKEDDKKVIRKISISELVTIPESESYIYLTIKNQVPREEKTHLKAA